jgi:hypothetical protein
MEAMLLTWNETTFIGHPAYYKAVSGTQSDDAVTS